MSDISYTLIKSGKKLIKLRFDDMLFIKGLGNYVEIVIKDETKYIYYKSLKELINKLPDDFMRVHNSYIVNLKNVDFVEDNHFVIGKHKITIAKTYKECLSKRINAMLL